jgi:hypothetical protein
MSTPRRSTRARRRRRIDVGLLLLIGVVVAIVTFVVAWQSSDERVSRLWVGATIGEDGSAQIVEVVDYDFGAHDRYGIFRDVPGLRTSAPLQVHSPDAPDDVAITTTGTPGIRIGDPARTVTGQHRYVLRYTLDGVAPAGELAWDPVGTDWHVPIEQVEVYVTAPAALHGDRCVAGAAGATDACAIRPTGPGQLLARADALKAGEGVTVQATAGAPLDRTSALPAPPAAAAPTPGTDPLVPGALAGAVALLVAAAGSRLIRRAGRERVPTVGIPATAPPGEEARIDLEQLARYAAPSPFLPETLSPAQGGVLLTGGVLDRHKAAWLIGEAVAGTIDLESGDGRRGQEVTMVRLHPGDGTARPLLDLAFGGRERLPLGTYDWEFAGGWRALGEELAGWRRTCGLWDPDADRRMRRVRILGAIAAPAGLALALLGGYLSARQSGLPLVLAGVGGALAGAGSSAAIRGWELRVLTTDGSATWLQVESLRQFLAQSPHTAIDEAIASGLVGQYTAWAVALGQAERWSQLASSASVPARSSFDTRGLRYATYGPVFVAGFAISGVSPSSLAAAAGAGAGAGGGGGVGGGAGGGGGGSW